jgi:hypothetical protein
MFDRLGAAITKPGDPVDVESSALASRDVIGRPLSQKRAAALLDRLDGVL